MDTNKRKTEQIPVPVYFNPTTFSAVCKDAQKAGKRGVMIQEKHLKAHGFANEYAYSIKGIGKFLKYCWQYWRDNEAERLAKAAEVLARDKLLQEEKKKLGLIQ